MEDTATSLSSVETRCTQAMKHSGHAFYSITHGKSVYALRERTLHADLLNKLRTMEFLWDGKMTKVSHSTITSNSPLLKPESLSIRKNDKQCHAIVVCGDERVELLITRIQEAYQLQIRVTRSKVPTGKVSYASKIAYVV